MTTIDGKALEAARKAYGAVSSHDASSAGLPAAITAYLAALPPPKIEGFNLDKVPFDVRRLNQIAASAPSKYDDLRVLAGRYAKLAEAISSPPSPVLADDEEKQLTLTEAQISTMVNRFLTWKLPDTFSPDGGISFQRVFRGFDRDTFNRPVGTNLFDANQATEMVRHMIEALS